MPYKTLDELPAQVREALPIEAQEIYLSVFNDAFGPDCDDACASKKAWGAVKKSYTQKGDEWVKNLIDLTSIGNAIDGTHDVTLQRLDTLIKNNGRMIHYSKEAFQNVDLWIGIPVVYAQTQCDSLRHPTHAEVTENNLPVNMWPVGRVTTANISVSGEPTLKGKIEIDDPAIDAMVSAGEMSISTGFSASIGNVDGQDKIIGNVIPNHVLLFKRGACRNCYPNDNRGRFEKVKENEEMDEESKGILKKLGEYLENIKPAEHVQEEIKEMTDNTEELKNVTEERDALKARIEAMENAAEQAKKDAAWNEIKNVLPEGWLGDKEKESREAFENTPAAFTVKLAKFTAENGAPALKAEGSESGGEPMDAENLARIEVEKFEKESGLHFF